LPVLALEAHGLRRRSASAGRAARNRTPRRWRPGALNNPVSTLKTRIDLILSRGAARSSGGEAELVGVTPFQAEPPFWPSDHAGVVGGIRLGG
jgi:hypothetical protein